MNKVKTSLAAGFALALAFTISCSDDPEEVGNVSACSLNGGTVEIANRTWMKENLNCDVSGSFCYDNDPANCAIYGRLYNWEAAKSACPSGFHLPVDGEWDVLVNSVGGNGGKLKANNGWNDYEGQSGNGTNESGFSALPGGAGGANGNFVNVGNVGVFWSGTEYGTGALYAYFRFMDGSSGVIRSGSDKPSLYSVRCIKD